MSATFTEPLILTNTTAVTADELLYEIVDGRRVELPPMSVYANLVASTLFGEFAVFCRAHPMNWTASLYPRRPANTTEK